MKILSALFLGLSFISSSFCYEYKTNYYKGYNSGRNNNYANKYNNNYDRKPKPKSYQQVGGVVYGSDGTTYQKVGNVTYGSDGTTYQKIGNGVYGSDGSSFINHDCKSKNAWGKCE